MNRRLYRSRTDRVLGGVAAGLAGYLTTDPALVRIAWVILAFITNGAALLAYIVAWVVVPEEPAAATASNGDGENGGAPAAPAASAAQGTGLPATSEPRRRDDGRVALVVGIGLVALGAWFLVRPYLPPIDWGLVWPIALIAIGVLILVSSARRRTMS